jgi:hypothetical protein
MEKKYSLILDLFLLLLVLAAGYLLIFARPQAKNNQPAVTNSGGNNSGGNAANNPGNTNPANITYTNSEYRFNFTLPASWKGYTIVIDKWQGYASSDSGETQYATGPQILIRHPLWTQDNPRQDIPIMVFTVSQWNDLGQDKFHIGAAPIGPSELGRNSDFVFALPARYNFAYPTGYEEVDQIIAGNPLHAF